MTVLSFVDATALANITGGPFDGTAFYLPGGDAYRAWPLSEVRAITTRYRLPVFVRSNPSAALAAEDAAVCIAGLRAAGSPAGTLVALDSETSVDQAYVMTFVLALNTAGWKVIDYGSESTLRSNLNPDGYYWGADWTSVPHLHSGEGMTQFLSLAGEDVSDASSALPLWDAKGKPPRPEAAPAFPYPAGDYLGTESSDPHCHSGFTAADRPHVAAWQGQMAHRGWIITIDGVYGSASKVVCQAFQSEKGLSSDGLVGPTTWAASWTAPVT